VEDGEKRERERDGAEREGFKKKSLSGYRLTVRNYYIDIHSSFRKSQPNKAKRRPEINEMQ